MKRVFISDLHLCDGSKAEDFDHEFNFLGFVTHYILKGVDELYLVGDIFELWQTTLEAALVVHKQPIVALKKIARRIKTTYIFGNHNYWFSYFKNPYPILFDNVVESCSIEGKPKIWVEHGHAYDEHNRTGAWSGKIATVLAGILERVSYPDIDEKALAALEEFKKNFKKIISFIPPADNNYPGDKSEYENAAKVKLTKENYDIVIFGHTHELTIRKIDKDKFYVNTGSWVVPEPTFVDITDNKICLYRWLGARAEMLKQANLEE